MRVVGRTETWIHAHFLTDGYGLTAAGRRQIKNEIESFLRLEGIVFGIHFEEARRGRGLCIVLECIPLPQVMERINARLEKMIRDIPARTPTLKRVRVERGEEHPRDVEETAKPKRARKWETVPRRSS